MAITQMAKKDIDLGRGGSYSASRDVLNHSLWDVLPISDLVPFPRQPIFFSTPLGSPYYTGQKGIQETNVLDNGKLPNGQTFLAKRIGLHLISHAFDYSSFEPVSTQLHVAWLDALHASYLRFIIEGREFDFEMHGSQFAPNFMQPVQAAGGASISSAGMFMSSGFLSLGDTPVFIDQLVSFKVQWFTGTGSSDVNGFYGFAIEQFEISQGYYVDVACTLDGILTRAK